MRIDRLVIENFKCFAKQTFDLHPHFNLFIGENGSGKTSVLDALAVAAGVWLVNPPDSELASSGRNIQKSEIRLEGVEVGDRLQFREWVPVRVSAVGSITSERHAGWSRQIKVRGTRTSNVDAKHVLQCIEDIYRRDADGEDVLCPVLAYYGAGRAWLPSTQRNQRKRRSGPSRRWSAFYDCLNERIRFAELNEWFRRETTERGNRGGTWRPGFEVVRRAILRCVPGAENVWFDADRDQIVLSIGGRSQPFENLSAGQRMMLALVAGLAIKAVTQNAHLVPPVELGPNAEVLRLTPGLVLIDELDVHLHPKWQRRVATDLKETFPSIQFVCTTHSPQIIGEVRPEEIRVLGENKVTTPLRSFEIDAKRVLEEVMDAPSRDEPVQAALTSLFVAIDKEDFAEARAILGRIESTLGPDDPEVTRARTLMAFLESPE